MKVFVSWSGDRSQLLAQAVHEWLPLVLHYVSPWLSQTNIDAGERWANEVAKELENSNFGIICVTRDNVESPWILFEAGALAKSLQGSKVIPLLLDLEFRDITGPLAQFQAKKVEKAGLWEIVTSINQNATQPVPEQRVKQLFEALWPELETRIGNIPKQTAPAKHTRSQPEVLEELVTGVRALDARFRDLTESRPIRRRRRMLDPMMMEDMLHGLKRRPGDPLGLLIIASQLREDVPWIYELALQAYHEAQSGNKKAAQTTVRRFRDATKMLMRGPFMHELGLDPMSIEMILHALERYGHAMDDSSSEAEENSDKNISSDSSPR